MLRLIQSFTRQRLCWFMLIVFGLAMEGCGLFFQYSLRLDPCVNCVYERAFFLGFIVVGIIGFLAPSVFLFRFIAILGFMASSVCGIMIAIEHYNSTIQTGLGSTCQLAPSFPSFLPLDEWLPWLFSAQGGCGPLDWSLLTLSMPQWIVLIFGCGIAISFMMFISQFVKMQHHSYSDLYR